MKFVLDQTLGNLAVIMMQRVVKVIEAYTPLFRDQAAPEWLEGEPPLGDRMDFFGCCAFIKPNLYDLCNHAQC